MRSTWRCLLGLCMVLVIVAPAGAQHRPRALEELGGARQRLETGRIEFSWQNHRDFAWPTFYTTRIAKQDEIIINRGDPEGVVGRRSDGTVNPAQGGPRLTLKLEKETWVYESNGLMARVEEEAPTAEHIWRLRSLGASYSNSYHDIEETLWPDRVKQPGARRYRQKLENGLHVVKAQTDYGAITWWIDAERGWSPVRVTLEQHGQIVRESRSTLKKFGDVWYPETVLFFSNRYKAGEEPLETIKVHAASFNQPEYPRRFTPKDIGVETGMTIEKVNADRSRELLVWDGSEAVTQAEFNELWAVGEIQLSPTYLRAVAQLEAQDAQRERRQDASDNGALRPHGPEALETAHREVDSKWVAYTRAFIERFQLNAEQARKAWAILRGCQGHANRCLALRHARLADLERKLRLRERAGDARAVKQLRAALDEARDESVKVVDEIFEQHLKPGLDRLPTRAQRAASQAASRPAPEQP